MGISSSGMRPIGRREEVREWAVRRVLNGEWTVAQAATVLGLGDRQVRRILAAYRAGGVQVLFHGNRGRRPSNALPPEIGERVLDMARCHPQLPYSQLAALLETTQGVHISRSTVRRILKSTGYGAATGESEEVSSPSDSSASAERMPQRGMLLYFKSSRQAWLGEGERRITLAVAIGAATESAAFAVFTELEGPNAYLLLLLDILLSRGIPLALNYDWMDMLRHHRGEGAGSSQRRGQSSTSFRVAIGNLGIQSVFLLPQACRKRVDQLWHEFKGQLASYLVERGIHSIGEANRALKMFQIQFNKVYGSAALHQGLAYRPLDPGLKIEEIASAR